MSRKVADAGSIVDVRLRLIAVALEPALARVSAVPLDDLQTMVTVGYFRELRSRGMTLRAIARRMHKSLRTVAGLSRLAAQQRDLLGGSERLRWRRKLVAHLGKHPRSSLPRLQRLSPKVARAELEEEGPRVWTGAADCPEALRDGITTRRARGHSCARATTTVPVASSTRSASRTRCSPATC